MKHIICYDLPNYFVTKTPKQLTERDRLRKKFLGYAQKKVACLDGGKTWWIRSWWTKNEWFFVCRSWRRDFWVEWSTMNILMVWNVFIPLLTIADPATPDSMCHFWQTEKLGTNLCMVGGLLGLSGDALWFSNCLQSLYLERRWNVLLQHDVISHSAFSSVCALCSGDADWICLCSFSHFISLAYKCINSWKKLWSLM